ncbi:hypothetical protein TMSI_38690 [Klebsiella quasipneumoniae]|nr:hypothetical protein TMSI_38690 [Klebsiella quasipneumoniae]
MPDVLARWRCAYRAYKVCSLWYGPENYGRAAGPIPPNPGSPQRERGPPGSRCSPGIHSGATEKGTYNF